MRRKINPANMEVRQECRWRLGLLIAVVLLCYALRDLNWIVVWESAPYLLRALGTSWLLAIVAIGLGLLLAVPLAAARVYGGRSLRTLSAGFVELIRSTPELMLMFWIFFALPLIFGGAVSKWWSGTIALTFLAAAYLAEVVRAGLQSVPRGQKEAALSTGLSASQAFFQILLPQAVKNMIPAFVGQIIMIFKTTSLVYVLGIVEFFRAIVNINSIEFASEPLYLAAAAVYFICCYALSLLIRRFDAKYVIYE